MNPNDTPAGMVTCPGCKTHKPAMQYRYATAFEARYTCDTCGESWTLEESD